MEVKTKELGTLEHQPVKVTIQISILNAYFIVAEMCIFEVRPSCRKICFGHYVLFMFICVGRVMSN